MGQVSPTILEEGGAGGVSEDIGLGSQRRGRRFRMILERMAIRSAFQDRGEPTLKCWGTLNWGGNGGNIGDLVEAFLTICLAWVVNRKT